MTSNILCTRRWALPAVFALALGLSAPAMSGEGHDHGDAPAAPNANGPQRQPDGSVFLPKPAQRQLGVRTLLTEATELPRSFELNGKVVIDPNAGGKVQPLNAGRIEPGPRGLPNAGQATARDDMLEQAGRLQGEDLERWMAGQTPETVGRLMRLADNPATTH